MPIYNLDDLIAQNERTQRAVNALVASASATTGHAMTADAGRTWASNVTPEELANMTLPPGKITELRIYDGRGNLVMSSGPSTVAWSQPQSPAHWSDDFAPLPVIDPSMLESRTELDPDPRYILRTQAISLAEAQRLYPAPLEPAPETRSEREDTIARIWSGMATQLATDGCLSRAAAKDETAEAIFARLRERAAKREKYHQQFMQAINDAMPTGTGWVGVDFASVYKEPGATNAAAYAGARDSDCAGIDAYLASPEEYAAALRMAAAYKGARAADCDAIAAYLMEPQPEPELPKTTAPSRIKPAITGLGVTAPEDHRLGGWKQL